LTHNQAQRKYSRLVNQYKPQKKHKPADSIVQQLMLEEMDSIERKLGIQKV